MNEYINRADVLNILRGVRESPARFTKDFAMERVIADISSLPAHAAATFNWDQEDMARQRERDLNKHWEQVYARAQKIAQVILMHPADKFGECREVLKIEGIMPTLDGLVITVRG